jgi:O-antigen ligase
MEPGIQIHTDRINQRIARIYGALTLATVLILGIAVSQTYTLNPLYAYFIPILLALLGLGALLFIHKGIWILLLALVIRSSLEYFSGFRVAGSLNLASLIAVTILALTLVRLYSEKKINLTLNFRIIPYILLIIWGLFSIFSPFKSSWTLAIASVETARMLSNLSIFWLVLAFVKERKDFTLLLKAMVLSSLIPLAAGFISLTQGYGTTMIWGIPGMVRIKGIFAHPNNYAHYLLIIGLCAYILYRFVKLGRRQIGTKPLGLLLSIILGSLALTFSRSALIALIVAVLLLSVNSKKTLLKAVFLIAILALIFTALFPSFVEYTFTQTLRSSNPSESTLASRFWIWEQGIVWAQRSPIFGYGPGSFNKLVGIDAHNDYLRVLVEYGLPGLLLLVSVSIIQLRDGLRLLKKCKNLLQKYLKNGSMDAVHLTLLDLQKGIVLARIFLALQITLLVLMFGANLFNFPVLQWYFFGLWGAIVAYHEYINRQ